jgi:hypothetical protein
VARRKRGAHKADLREQQPLEREYRRAHILAIDPPELGEAVGETIRIERDRIDATGVPLAEHASVLRDFIRRKSRAGWREEREAAKDCDRGKGWYESPVDGCLRCCGEVRS